MGPKVSVLISAECPSIGISECPKVSVLISAVIKYWCPNVGISECPKVSVS